jgi:hypothetical protein
VWVTRGLRVAVVASRGQEQATGQLSSKVGVCHWLLCVAWVTLGVNLPPFASREQEQARCQLSSKVGVCI